jgi:2-haloacid dehalogenase
LKNVKMDYGKIHLLSFDCYGTLIDWKESVLRILASSFADSPLEFSRDEWFSAFLEADRKMISDRYLPYREVLAEVIGLMAENLRISIDPASRYLLSDRFSEWAPFPDTVRSLKQLKEKYRLAIISNVDDELFSISNQLLEVDFDFIVTAGQIGSYKPDKRNFIKALEIFGVGKAEHLHVAQSIYHDIVPAKQLGMNTVWVNRYGEPERSDPREFPDLEVPDLKSLVKILKIEEA